MRARCIVRRSYTLSETGGLGLGKRSGCTVPASVWLCSKRVPNGMSFAHCRSTSRRSVSEYWCHIYDCVILCHCTLAAALYFEQSSCDELMEFKQIQTRAQPEESLKHNHSCTNLSPERRSNGRVLCGLVNQWWGVAQPLLRNP